MRHKQRGAYSFLFLVILIGGGLLVFALAADGARLYAQQRVLQQQADAAALAATQGAHACGGVSAGPASPCNLVATEAARGNFSDAYSCEDVQVGVLETNEEKLLEFRPSTFEASNAVKVTLRRTVPRSMLLPGRIVGKAVLTATSAAKKEIVATVSASGITAQIGGDNGDRNAGLLGELLGGLLRAGSSFKLDATDIRSLESATFDIGVFLQALGVADVLGAANKPVGADKLLEAVLVGLDEGLGGAADILDDIISKSEVLSTDIVLGDVVRIVGSAPPQDIQLPVYDTLVSLVLGLYEGRISQPINIGLGIDDLVKAELRLKVGQAPAVVVGPARFDPEPFVVFDVADITLSVVVLVDVLGLARVEIPLLVDTGGGEGFLRYAECASGMTNDVKFGFSIQPKAVTISTDKFSDGGVESSEISLSVLPAFQEIIPTISINGKVPPLAIGEGELSDESVEPEVIDYNLNARGVASVTTGSDLSISAVDGLFELTVNINFSTPGCAPLDIICHVNNALANVLKPVLDIANVGLEQLAGALEDLVEDLVGEVLANVLHPILASLGVHVGGMSVSVLDASQQGAVLISCSNESCN